MKTSESLSTWLLPWIDLLIPIQIIDYLFFKVFQTSKNQKKSKKM